MSGARAGIKYQTNAFRIKAFYRPVIVKCKTSGNK